MLNNFNHIENNQHREIMRLFWTTHENSCVKIATIVKLDVSVVTWVISKYLDEHFDKIKTRNQTVNFKQLK